MGKVPFFGLFFTLGAGRRARQDKAATGCGQPARKLWGSLRISHCESHSQGIPETFLSGCPQPVAALSCRTHGLYLQALKKGKKWRGFGHFFPFLFSFVSQAAEWRLGFKVSDTTTLTHFAKTVPIKCQYQLHGTKNKISSAYSKRYLPELRKKTMNLVQKEERCIVWVFCV